MLNATSAQVITSADQFKSGSSIYIIAGEEWTSMEQLSEAIISKIDNSIGIITATDGVSHAKTNRVKRVATDEMDTASGSTSGGSATGNIPFPLILPPYNNTQFNIAPDNKQSCLFYLEGVSVVLQQRNDKTLAYASVLIPGTNLTYGYANGDVSCQNGTIGEFLFRLRLQLNTDVTGKQGNNPGFSIKSGERIDVSLNITGDLFGYWQLTGATANTLAVSGLGNFKSGSSAGQTIGEDGTRYSKINSVAGWALACGQTQAIFFPTEDPNVQIGVALVNTQIQTFNVQNVPAWLKAPHFTLQTEDCQGTFSAGSWMGIVSALVLIAGLLFGYVMLQSVQTMDRFDDPKQKQIVINVRE
uniref:Ac45-VOA1_TM domain-containing protein n=1 Tax=Caenorhabditis tropicalis TaxID=1561998 RepID=A0A1I7UH13_9PELO